ncbi:hypothetical protein Tco_0001645 [Tanacetum coccineum]
MAPRRNRVNNEADPAFTATVAQAVADLHIRCSTDESICYRYTFDVQRMSRYVNMVSLYIRFPTDESICYRCTLDVRLLVGSPGASTAPIYSPGSSSTPIYSPGSSTPPRYSLGASTPPSYSLGTSRNAECSNCKHLLKLQAILWELQEMQNVIRML